MCTTYTLKVRSDKDLKYEKKITKKAQIQIMAPPAVRGEGELHSHRVIIHILVNFKYLQSENEKTNNNEY